VSPRARWLAVEIVMKAGLVVLFAALLGTLLLLPKNLVPAGTGVVLGILTWDTLRQFRRPRRRKEDELLTFLGYVQVAILSVALGLEIAHGHAVPFAIGLALGAFLRLSRRLVVNSSPVRRHEELRARGLQR